MNGELEIREIYETRTEADTGPVLKKYMVHIVQPATDTLFQLSYRYKVSKRELQYINKFSGEEIYFLKILIPLDQHKLIDRGEDFVDLHVYYLFTTTEATTTETFKNYVIDIWRDYEDGA